MSSSDIPDDLLSRRVIDRLGEIEELPVVNVDRREARVLGPPAALFGVAAMLAGVPIAAPVAIFAGTALGAALVKASPPHLLTSTWLKDLAHYYVKMPARTTAKAGEAEPAPGTDGGDDGVGEDDAEAPSPDPEEDQQTESGGRLGVSVSNPFELDETTAEYLGCERVWPGAGIVERANGTMEAFVELQPATMDFALPEEWAEVQQTVHQQANQQLDFSVRLYATTEAFPVEQLFSHIDQRLADDDVNPVFESILADYRASRAEHFSDQQEVHFYLRVTAEPTEAHGKDVEQSVRRRLLDQPFVGPVVGLFLDATGDLSEEQHEERLAEVVNTRLKTVETDVIETIPEWESRQLSALEILSLQASHVSGTAPDAAAVGRRLRDAGEAPLARDPGVADEEVSA